MITRTSRLDSKDAFLRASELIFSLCCDEFPADFDEVAPKDLMFFDIETTGLSPDTSYLYLIGCLYLDGDEVVHTQFFSEGIADERELIESYDELLASHRVLAHFNGQTFDIPYIERKRARLNLISSCEIVHAGLNAICAPLPQDTSANHVVLSFDIFKYLRGYKKFLNMSSMSQKSLEAYCGLNREDIYDGGQLIEVYGRYIATKKLEDLRAKSALQLPEGCDSASLLKVLLLHNYEDVLGMLEVCRMLALPAFLRKYSASPVITGCTCDDRYLQVALKTGLDLFMLDRRTIECPDGSVIRITAVSGSNDAIGCSDGNGKSTVILTIPIIENEFRFFHSDYKNYFYLPAEDSAIPRSIGEFMDKSLRTKCTPANCYTRHYLRVVPLTVKPSKDENYSFKVFKTDFKSTARYTDISQLTADETLMSEYIQSAIRGI